MAFKILNRDFKYRNAESTDIRLTFERIRREQRKRERTADLEFVRKGAKPTKPLHRT